MVEWLVVGISGVTCSGKSTLARRLHHTLPSPSTLLNQDYYFYPEGSSHHIPAPAGLNHHNWEVITSIDVDTMLKDVRDIVRSPPSQLKAPTTLELVSRGEGTSSNLDSAGGRPVLVIDGFLLFSHPEVWEVCDLRYFLTLTREQCWERRQRRQYEPPDPPGYFHQCVWPEYEQHRQYVNKLDGIIYLDGMVPSDDTYTIVFQDIINHLKKRA
ncbi:nicotinamide riboside kinase 1 [Procambarus clarkii]|uniref:nicotinamide riboside kinase 1 n=1 Tax=Procambarus clarkii TaxID=6728 RepID=UPI001E675059|nr:nicotinamide riboside kinase 1-like [Procambarus clarkii]XP_045606676.1 nicotinamide riboside kinase 1-like [Procambarus clarkii]XP_045606677.1 nicotinamide riboside kinase 1-like [Procambarus clarkii]